MEEQKNDLQEEVANVVEEGEAPLMSKISVFYAKYKIWVWIVGVILAVCMIYAMFEPDTYDEMQGIEIVDEQLVTDVRYTLAEGDYLFPIVMIEVENTSSETKEVSVKINFYADGTLLGEGQSSYVTLMPGDKTILKAQSNKGYYVLTAINKEYTYKITEWMIY